ncbi:MAG TPA: hypothetical protein VFP12_03175 [Allosphingosinicella sp.]|nr:hypothetical protein [Allosphingosinicella sp.]
MRIVASALLLVACASNGSNRHLLITDTHHGPIVWHKFETQEACEQASREGYRDFVTRCTTRKDLRRR